MATPYYVPLLLIDAVSEKADQNSWTGIKNCTGDLSY
jgi:hypothetical protein